MNIGFVYILLNPAFPNLIKIGKTDRNSNTRALELSRQTGVPSDYIVLYDELVSDSKQVEDLLQIQFSNYRHKRNKEFFSITPKEAIKELQKLAVIYSIQESTTSLKSDLFPHFRRYFSDYIDKNIESIKLVLLPSICYLEVKRRYQPTLSTVVEKDDIPLCGLIKSSNPTMDDLRKNESLLKSCDAYDWAMISNVFPEEKCRQIPSRSTSPEVECIQKLKKHHYE